MRCRLPNFYKCFPILFDPLYGWTLFTSVKKAVQSPPLRSPCVRRWVSSDGTARSVPLRGLTNITLRNRDLWSRRRWRWAAPERTRISSGNFSFLAQNNYNGICVFYWFHVRRLSFAAYTLTKLSKNLLDRKSLERQRYKKKEMSILSTNSIQ